MSCRTAPEAVLALIAGLLHELHPATYDPAQHPIDRAALRDAEQLLAGLDEHGMTVTPWHNTPTTFR